LGRHLGNNLRKREMELTLIKRITISGNHFGYLPGKPVTIESTQEFGDP